MAAQPHRTGLILTALLLAALSAAAAHAEQLTATQDHFALMLPDGWKINLTWQDAAASILNLQGPAFGIDATFYVVNLDNHPDRTPQQMIESFQEIESVVGLAPAPTPQLTTGHPTCPLTLTNMQSDAARVFFLSCKHPTAPRLYLWRLAVPDTLLPQGDGLSLNLARFVIANFVLIDPATAQPIAPVPPGFSMPAPTPAIPPIPDAPTPAIPQIPAIPAIPDAPTPPTPPTPDAPTATP